MHRGVLGLIAVLILLGALAGPNAARGDGREYTARRHDLALVIDTRWAGCRHGGYYPIRIRATNVGPARNLTFSFSSDIGRGNLPSVRRTIGLDQNATVQFTLSVPMVGYGNYGTFAISHQGRVLEGLQWDLSLADINANEPQRPAMLVISPKTVDTAPFDLASGSIFWNQQSGSSAYMSYSGTPAYPSSSGSGTGDAIVLAPTLLPDSWIDYSGLDVVSVSLDTFAALPSGPRKAIVDWVEMGGTLILSEVGTSPDQSEPLRRALSLDGRAAVSAKWKEADLATRREVRIPVEAANEGEPSPAPLAVPQSLERRWSEKSDAFATRDVMLGKVVAVSKDLFAAKAGDWHWLLSALGNDRLLWTRRHGYASRDGHDEFLYFEIPGLRGVPVSSFLTLITLFAIGIGPVNYFILYKKKKLWMLVVTIPAIAFLTSASLFAWSTVAHGFSVKSRTRSLTVLDQNAHTAVTTSRLSLFAGLAPSSGLKFSPETAVHTIWQGRGSTFESGRVDWTSTQALEAGWLRSRTRTQFVTETHRTERGRMVVKPLEGELLPVENGLEWDILALVVSDEKGAMFAGTSLPAGGATRLPPVQSTQELEAFNRHLEEFPLRAPPGAEGYIGRYNNHGYGHRYYYDQYQAQPQQFSTGIMEQELAKLTRLSVKGQGLPPKSYALILKDNPGIEKGVESPSERAPLHVLVGHY